MLLKDVYLGLLLTRLALLTTELEARRREHSSVLQELDKCRKKVADFKRQASCDIRFRLRSNQFEKHPKTVLQKCKTVKLIINTILVFISQ
jgi:hypothetical protein